MKWYDGSETLSHNCLFNFVIGERGVGKTYWSKNWSVRDFLKSGGQFVYVRRYDTELDTLSNYWNAVRREYPEHVLEVKGKEFMVDDKIAGYAVALSTSGILKSTEFPGVNKIIFDEFLIEQGTHHYLKEEVKKFLDLYETIARLRENVVVFFLANAITMTNPYFNYFNIRIPYGNRFYKRGDILFQYLENKEFREAKAASRFGKIIEGTHYADYSVNNIFLLDTSTFIEKKGSHADFTFAMSYLGKRYGVWVDYKEGKLWVSNDIPPRAVLEYAITLTDHSENTLLIKALSRSNYFKTFLESYRLGRVYFEDLNIKNATYEIIKVTMR